MKRILIYPYSIKSASALALKAALGAQFIKKENSQYVSKPDDLVINWGSTGVPFYQHGATINSPISVGYAVNKYATFDYLESAGVSSVPWTTDVNVAKGWLNSGKKVVVRLTATGSGGKDIEIYDASRSLLEGSPAADFNSGYQTTWDWLKGLVASNSGHTALFYLPNAPLYTQYIEKEAELRVHVGGGSAAEGSSEPKARVIHTQMKLRKNGIKASEVWNHDNGYCFTSDLIGRVSNGIIDRVQTEGIKAVEALGLDFGAVDIAWSGGLPYVLEVNTAPGIEEPTLSKYVEYFKKVHNV